MSDGDFLRALTSVMEQHHIEAFLRGLVAKLEPKDVVTVLTEMVRSEVRGPLVRKVLTETYYDGRQGKTLLQEMTQQAVHELLTQEEFKALLRELLTASITTQLKTLNVTLSTGRY